MAGVCPESPEPGTEETVAEVNSPGALKKNYHLVRRTTVGEKNTDVWRRKRKIGSVRSDSGTKRNREKCGSQSVPRERS